MSENDVVNGDHFLLGGPILWFLKKTSHPTSANPDCNATGHINVYTFPPVLKRTDIDVLQGFCSYINLYDPPEIKNLTPISHPCSEFEF
jgi:hypothetical protein